jgi:prevent-host-death family protein
MDEIGIERARNLLGEIVEQARLAEQPTRLTRHGKPAAVVVNADWYGQVTAALEGGTDPAPSDPLTGPTSYLIGLWDGMRKITAPGEEDWERFRRCIREVCDDLAALVDQRHMAALVEASSLGTPGAKALRARTPPEVVAEVRRRAADSSSNQPRGDPE